MKKLITTLALLPSMAMAHVGPPHLHPEEMTSGLILLIVAGAAYMLWKQNKD